MEKVKNISAIYCKIKVILQPFLNIVYSIITILTIGVSISYSQDAHFSQFDVSPIILNPAFTGMIPVSDIRVAAQYRSQWGSMAPNFSSVTLAGEKPINKRFGAGIYMMNDDGVKAFNTFNLMLSGAYRITDPNLKKINLFVGLQAGFLYKSINQNQLIFDNQYENGSFNSDKPSGEAMDEYGKLMPDVNIGINFEYVNAEKKFNPYASFSIFHCTYPNESFLETTVSRLPLRFALAGGSKVLLTPKLNLDPKFLFMHQGTSNELLFGMNGNFDYNPDISFTTGGFYRLKDAAIILIGFRYKNVTYRMNYDINISPLKTFTKGHGGLEFSIVYTLLYNRGSSRM